MSDVDGTVVAIQGRDVDTAAPNDGDVYRWDATNSKWIPAATPSPLEPWVGSVNTQAQVIKRIPWTCRTVGATPSSTGVAVTLPTDKAVTFLVHHIHRHATSVAGMEGQLAMLAALNNGGTVTVGSANQAVASVVGTFAGSVDAGIPTMYLDVSGTTVTLYAVCYTADGASTMEFQGYVDLMVA
jgi:hypothetical protein